MGPIFASRQRSDEAPAESNRIHGRGKLERFLHPEWANRELFGGLDGGFEPARHGVISTNDVCLDT